ncbi:DgyrCDS12947 [Dimorphilus gyrociliatus]|uniref:DgyrCDS12947 n=1 Tax=Dimorphilus gyrociliatus TaxID=2664684 RepID=A0A7I8W974_9ANNE|nr:DgyrCDS12947 [Dimorphilus gyrociliatus]
MSVTCNLQKRLQVIHREKTINDVHLRKSQTFIETSKNKINQSMKKLREENWTKQHEAKGSEEWRDLTSASVRANLRRERLLLIEQIHKDKRKSKLGNFYNQVEEHKVELEKSKTFMPSLSTKRKESGLDSLIAFSKAITAFMNFEKKPNTGDENSPEALKRCKYLRIYEKRTEEVEKPTSIK